MSTIPFTLIEGAMALPRSRPLNHLPAPFGSEWVLLPPNISFRRELRALYAAVLRTFCLGVEEMRALSSWASKQKTAMAAPLDPASDAGITGVGVDGGAADGMARTAVAVEAGGVDSVVAASVAPAFATSIGVGQDEARPAWRGVQTPSPATVPSPIQRTPNGTPFPLTMLAGGACAIGGAAVLAWLALGHSAHRQTVVERSTPEGVSQSGSLKNSQSVSQGGLRQGSEQSAAQRSATAATPATSTSAAARNVVVVQPSARIAASPQTSAQAPQIAAQETTSAAAQRRLPTVVADTVPSKPAASSTSVTLATQAATTTAATSRVGSDAAPRRDRRADTQYSTRAATHRETSQALAQTDAQAAHDLAYAPSHHSSSQHSTSSRASNVTSQSTPSRASNVASLPTSSRASNAASQSTSSRASNVASQPTSTLAAVDRAGARPSAAGEYSPLAPSMLGNDEYASVTMSAGTHLRGMAAGSRAGTEAAASTTPIDTNSTEWMNRMSQRRVTDIPDQFSK